MSCLFSTFIGPNQRVKLYNVDEMKTGTSHLDIRAAIKTEIMREPIALNLGSWAALIKVMAQKTGRYYLLLLRYMKIFSRFPYDAFALVRVKGTVEKCKRYNLHQDARKPEGFTYEKSLNMISGRLAVDEPAAHQS